MELVLVHITDIHLENDTDYNILEGRSEYIANAINKTYYRWNEYTANFCVSLEI